jgi:predicted O-methyltransferase YrrM
MSGPSFEGILRFVLGHRQPKQVLEWGPGCSTRMMLEFPSVSRIMTLEHDQGWYEKAVTGFRGDSRVEVVKRTVGGYGAANGYSNYPLRLAMLDGMPWARYDLIFIDGRMRCDCLVAARQLIREDGVVMIHDTYRENYVKALDVFPYVRVYKKIGTAVGSVLSLEWLDAFDEDAVPS